MSRIEQLVQIGLNEKEAIIYMAALEIGAATALQLSQATGIKRSTVYTVLDSLINQGLMYTQTYGVKQKYVVENPEKLHANIADKQAIVTDIMPDLTAMFMQLKGTDSFIKHYSGLPGVKTVYRQLLAELKQKDSYCVITDRGKWLSMDPVFFEQYLRRRARLKLDIKVLLQSTQQAGIHLNKKEEYKLQAKVLPKSILLNTTMVIVPHKVILTQTVAPLLSIVIENRSVVQTHQALFNAFWDMIS